MEKINIVMNLEPHLTALEYIFNKYIPNDPHARFVIGNRYPITANSKIPDVLVRYVSSIPYYPYKCLSFITTFIVTNIYLNSHYAKLFKKNKIIPVKMYTDFIPYSEYEIEDMLSCIIDSRYLNLKDVKEIEKLVFNIYNLVTKYTDTYDGHIITIDSDSEHIILQVGEHIGVFRMRETELYFEAQQDLDELDDEVEGVIPYERYRI